MVKMTANATVTKQVAFTVSEEVYAELEKVAERERCSVAELARGVVKSVYLVKDELVSIRLEADGADEAPVYSAKVVKLSTKDCDDLWWATIEFEGDIDKSILSGAKIYLRLEDGREAVAVLRQANYTSTHATVTYAGITGFSKVKK